VCCVITRKNRSCSDWRNSYRENSLPNRLSAVNCRWTLRRGKISWSIFRRLNDKITQLVFSATSGDLNRIRRGGVVRWQSVLAGYHQRHGQLWSWTDAAAPREAPLAWRQRSCDVQAGGHGPSMREWPGTSVPRRSMCPAVQSETPPFCRAISTARTTSPTQHVRPPPGFCHCWSVRLEQSLDPVPNPNSTEAAFRGLLKTFLFARYYSAPSALGRSACWCAIYIDTLTLTLSIVK